MSNLIDRQAVIVAVKDALLAWSSMPQWRDDKLIEALVGLPSAQSETCEGCKHLGKWENELEYGYPSPCTRCKRNVGDHYER